MCLEKEKSENGIEIWANTDLSWNRDDFFSHQHGATYHSFHLPPRIQPLLSKYTGFVKMNLSHALKYEFSLSLNFMFNLLQTEKNEFCFQPQKTSASKYQFGLLLLLGAQCFSVYEKKGSAQHPGKKNTFHQNLWHLSWKNWIWWYLAISPPRQDNCSPEYISQCFVLSRFKWLK